MAPQQIMNPTGRYGTTNLSALLRSSHGNAQDMWDHGHLRWSGSWMDSGLDLGAPKEPLRGDICPTCYTTKALTGACDNCD